MFKYSGVTNYALRNLKNNEIYLSSPKDFNDPFEDNVVVKKLSITDDEFIKELIKNAPTEQFKKSDLHKLLNKKFSKIHFRRFMENHYDFFYPQSKKKNQDKESYFKVFDLNFEKNKKNIEAWFARQIEGLEKTHSEYIKKYTNELNHTDVGVSCFSEDNNNILMWSHYADKHKGFCIEFNKSYEPFLHAETVIYGQNIPEFNFSSNDIHKKFLYYKSVHWKYEKELRIVMDKSNVPRKYKKESLKAIYFGLRADKTDMDIICTIAKANNPNVKFYKMEKKHLSFELESHPCTCNITEKQPVLQQ